MKEALNMESIKNIYMDELIRDNARMAVQHEADRLKIEMLEQQIADQAANIASLEAHAYAQEDAEERHRTEAKLAQAHEVIHFLMKSGDPCKVCAKTCKMGEECVPLWRGGADL